MHKHSWEGRWGGRFVCEACGLLKEIVRNRTVYIAPTGRRYRSRVPYPCFSPELVEKLEKGERVFTEGPVFMGSGDYTQLKIQLLLRVLRGAVEELSGIQQNDLQGTTVDEELDKEAERRIRNAAEDIWMALTGEEKGETIT